MATLSKRHQARNEKALQELIRTVPGNDRCADCGARNPGWASWSLGIFLCMRCASLHRKLGTHISKVKSLSMDSWSNEQVDHMRRNGNVAVNKTYNPRNAKPEIPLDVDEVEIVLEKFIKQKYDQQVYTIGGNRPAARDNTGNTSSTRSSEDRPPPLPPKPGKRFGFGFRSASSALPASSNSALSSPRSPDGFSGPPSPMRANKQSRVFGASIGGDDIETKLFQLREMGFVDEKRNLTVLQGHGGNLEKTIESLVRLGEGSAPVSRSRTPLQARTASGPLAQSSTQPISAGNGISVNKTRDSSRTNTAPANGSNSQGPAKVQDPAVQSLSPTNPYQTQTLSQPYNPFNMSNQQQGGSSNIPLDQAFQGIQISQQPLFPNVTGGYPSQPPPIQDIRAQTMTPPVPQIPQQFVQTNFNVQPTPNVNNHNPFFSPAPQQQGAPIESFQQNSPQIFSQPYNPFFQQNNTYQQPQLSGYAMTPPYTTSSPVQQGSYQQPPVAHQQQQSVLPPTQPQAQPQLQASNPFQPIQHSFTDPAQFQNNPQIPHQQRQQQQQQQSLYQHQLAPLQPQQTGRMDKSSILALYNYPQLAPPSLPHDINTSQSQIANTQTAQQPPEQFQQQQAQSTALQAPPVSAPRPNQRSVTMPAQLVSGSRNPFQTTTNTSTTNSTVPSPPTNGVKVSGSGGSSRHISQESVDVGGYQNGRHSPDAFASLSARYVR